MAVVTGIDCSIATAWLGTLQYLKHHMECFYLILIVLYQDWIVSVPT